MGPQESTQDRPSHDDVYAAVFSLVGQTSNETYEGLAKVLPSIKETDPAEIKELAARKALRELLNPPKDPLLLDFEKAAAEEDEDLSTEDGEWLDASEGKEREVDEELDELGIPVMKLARASSSFILDGPGDVKVDNFTPEAQDGPDEGGASLEGCAALTPATVNSAPAAVAAAAAGGTAAGRPTGAAVTAGYVPSVISRAKGATAAAAPSAVVTLEDEIRAMRATPAGATPGPQPAAAAEPSPAAPRQRAAADGNPSPASPDRGQRPQGDGPASEARQHGGQHGGHASAWPDDSGCGDVGDGDSDAPEVVPEPPGALLTLPTGGGGSSRRLLLLRGGVAGDGEGRSDGGGGAGAVMAAELDMEEGTSLPGTCQDTSAEDALWVALQGVDGRALVEHMGLAEPDAGSSDQAEAEEDAGPHGVGPTAVVASATTAAAAIESPPPTTLPNGHLGGSDDGGPESGPGNSSSGGGGGNGGGADVANAATNGSVPESTTAPAAAPAGRASASGAAAADGGGGMELALRRAMPVALAAATAEASSSPSVDGPTFETVEAFSLDPDFDYDNVQLTPRDFPYSMLNARWAAGGGFGARAAR